MVTKFEEDMLGQVFETEVQMLLMMERRLQSNLNMRANYMNLKCNTLIMLKPERNGSLIR